MSIATELQDLNDNILDAYTAVQGKGGAVPTNKNMANLPTAISSISGGGSFVGIPREVNASGVYGFPAQNFTFSLPSNATDVGDNALFYAFNRCTSLVSVDLDSLTTISGNNTLYYAFTYCSNLASVDLSSLATISGDSALYYAFNYCSNLASVDLSSLATISGGSAFFSAFQSCSSLTSVSFPALTTVSGSNVFYNAFRNCSRLTSLSFPALTASSFGSRTNQFNRMLQGCSNVTVHFPAAIQSTIGSWSDVTAGFGGTNTTVLFDL